MIITSSSLRKMKNYTKDYTYTKLYRLSKSNKLSKIIKGKYTTSDDIYEIATNIYNPCYISFWSAAYFKGYTEQIINTIQIATTRKHSPIIFQKYNIEYHVLPKKLFFGYKKIVHKEGFIFVVDDEKLIIDMLLKKRLSGNIDEIIKTIKNAKIDTDKIISYLKNVNNKNLTKQAGFLLEKYKNIDISKKMLYKDKNYARLSNAKNINKKWMVKY